MGVKGKLLAAFVCLLALVGIGFGIKWSIDYDRTQKKIDAAQLQEFTADLLTNNFDQATTKVVWKEETDCHGQNCKTEKELDGTVVVANCPFQVERSEATADGKPPVVNGNRSMKHYKLDEFVDGSKDGLDVTEKARDRDAFTTPRPTARQVYDYLVRYKDTVFKRCFDPRAAVPIG